MMSDDTFDVVRAAHEIEQVLLRYTRGVDRLDWGLVRSAYHDDAVDCHGDYRGGVAGLIDHLMRRHANIEQSLHAVSNITYDWRSASEAVVESYYICYQRLRSAAAVEAAFRPAAVSGDETLQLTAVGRYVDRFTRCDGAWRIAHRHVTFDLLKAEPVARGGGLPATVLLSRRDKEDILWQELADR